MLTKIKLNKKSWSYNKDKHFTFLGKKFSAMSDNETEKYVGANIAYAVLVLYVLFYAFIGQGVSQLNDEYANEAKPKKIREAWWDLFYYFILLGIVASANWLMQAYLSDELTEGWIVFIQLIALFLIHLWIRPPKQNY